MSGTTLAPAVAVLRIELRVIAYLEKLPRYLKPHLGELRREIGCTVTELHDTLGAMRAGGRLLPDKLALAPAIADSADVVADTARQADLADSGDTGGGSVEAPGGEPGEGDGASAAPTPSPAVSAGPLAPDAPGPILLRAIEIYCAATGTPETRIGKVLFNYPGFVGLLRKRGSIMPDKIAAVQKLMAGHPAGPPVEAPPPAVQPAPVAREPLPEAPPPAPLPAALADLALTPVEAIQSLVAETPEDLLRAVGRTHNDLWRRCVLFARLTDETPAAALYRALGAGLDVIEADFNEEQVEAARG